MSKIEYKYYLLKNCWLARLEKNRNSLENKEFLIDNVWQSNDELNLKLNDCIMNYGDSSIFDYDELSNKEALKLITSWDRALSKADILSAKECFLFGNDVLYIALDSNNDLFVCNLIDKSWKKRKYDSFWDSYNLSPELFFPLSNEEAANLVFTPEEEYTQTQKTVIKEDKKSHKMSHISSGNIYNEVSAEEILSSLAEKYKDDNEALENIERAKKNIAYIRSQKNYDGQTPEQYALEIKGFLEYWH